MTQIILHIGLHKTGTSSLQQFCAENEAWLLRHGDILYPKTGRDPRKHYHHELFRDVVGGGSMNGGMVKSVLDECNDKGASRVLLSSEMIARSSVTTAQLQKIKMAFGENPVFLIVYLRQQSRFVQSVYAERIKRGLLVAPETIRDVRPTLDHYRYIKTLATVFGIGSIRVRIFDSAISTGLYKDFIDALDIYGNIDFEAPASNANERLPWLYLHAMRYANKFTFTRKLLAHPGAQRMAATLKKIAPPKMGAFKPLSASEEEEINNQYKRSNDRLAKEVLNRRELF